MNVVAMISDPTLTSSSGYRGSGHSQKPRGNWLGEVGT